MTPEEAQRLIERGEGQTVEFKTTFAEERTAVETLCAFTNADGGTVFFGVRDDGYIAGVSLSANTRENFANALKAHTSPLVSPHVDLLTLHDRTVVAVTAEKAPTGEVFAAFDRFKVRVDKTNQNMSPDEVRARLLQGHAEERDRPEFEVRRQGLTRLETQFEPMMQVKHISGEQIATLEWRFRGPRFDMDWRQTNGSVLARAHFTERFDLSRPPKEDDQVGLNEMGFELRFHWRGKRRSQLRRWPITRTGPSASSAASWEMGDEILPPLYADET